MYKYLLILLFLCPSLIFSQDLKAVNKIALEHLNAKKPEAAIKLLSDSIQAFEKNNAYSNELIQSKLNLAKSYMHNWEHDKVENIYLSAMEISKAIDNDSMYLQTALFVVDFYNYKEQILQNLDLVEELLQHPMLNQKERSDLYIIKAGSFSTKQQWDSAIHYGNLSVTIDTLIRDSSSAPYSFYDLSRIYINDYQYEEGINSIIHGIRYLREGKDGHKRANLEIALGEVYYMVGHISKAEELGKKALQYAISSNLHVAQTYGYNLLGNCAYYNDNYQEALRYYIKSDSINNIKTKKLWRTVRAKCAIINSKLNLNLPIEKHELDTLRNIYKREPTPPVKNKINLLLLRIDPLTLSEFEKKTSELYIECNAVNDKQMNISLLKVRKEYYEKNGYFNKAIEIEKELDDIRKKIDQDNNKYIIQELDAKYQKEKQQNEIQLLEIENNSKAAIVKRQKSMLLIGGMALGLISILSFLLFNVYRRVNKQKKLISKALSEKDILMREIHHRVKNNLQLISSLLTLQGRSINDKKALTAINEGKSRVRSMALIHQDLYTKENITEISVKNYLQKLTKELFTTYQIENEKVELIMEIEDIDLDADTLVPLGLIINELITNSLKYAFPEGTNGKLIVSLKETDQELKLNIIDDGIGYNLDAISDSSFGSTLISALTDQLGGEIKINTENGTHTELTFSNYSIK